MANVIFALDSIPAIFGLTKDAYIIFTANALALMGLRQLYFLIGGLLETHRLPQHRAVGDPRVHRRQADHRGAARLALDDIRRVPPAGDRHRHSLIFIVRARRHHRVSLVKTSRDSRATEAD